MTASWRITTGWRSKPTCLQSRVSSAATAVRELAASTRLQGSSIQFFSTGTKGAGEGDGEGDSKGDSQGDGESDGGAGKGCVWQIGGAHIPGTTNVFGGTSTAEYGAPFKLLYATNSSPGSFTAINDYRQILSKNPCKVDE